MRGVLGAADMAKTLLFTCVAFLVGISVLEAVEKPPIVQVFSRHPVEHHKPNILNCYVDGFHPPKINITLLKNNEELPKKLSDLSFKNDWTFQLLAFADVVPNGKDKFSCKVEHVALKEPKFYVWDQEY
ncbi:beta-2-microglobulin [Elgaria multicarinata webbii]|uniref:beta-2-microglobulin n=1 Tax=Elgaria multicarinata webbii TaxID=159646 RepID=UPI002FCCE5FF